MGKKRFWLFTILVLTSLLSAACKGDDGGGVVVLNTIADGAPVAVPGPNQYVLPGKMVWLDGSGSFNPNGDSLIYEWKFVSKPSTTAELSSTTAADPDFYADALGQYVISLQVNNGVRSSAAETMTVAARIPVPDTGQTLSYTTTFGEDSDYTLHPLSYADNGDGTIKDNVTGLLWQKCTNGQNNDLTCSGPATAITWSAATSTCGSLTLAGGGWRLPTAYELGTIVNFWTHGPAINSVYFPNTAGSDYWSSSAWAQNEAYAWVVNFGFGDTDTISKTSGGPVRCVRGQ